MHYEGKWLPNQPRVGIHERSCIISYSLLLYIFSSFVSRSKRRTNCDKQLSRTDDPLVISSNPASNLHFLTEHSTLTTNTDEGKFIRKVSYIAQ